MNEPKVIMYDDPALVETVKVEAFKGADGNTYMSEIAARWNCCTHVKCDNCGGQAPRGWLLCDSCREATKIDRYNQLEKQEWDGKTPLYCDNYEQYFFNADDIYDFIEECKSNFPDDTLGDFRFLLCKPINLSEIDTDHWEDELPHLDYGGDGSLPSEVQAALDKLNQAIREHGKAVAWEPSKIAVNYKIESGE